MPSEGRHLCEVANPELGIDLIHALDAALRILQSAKRCLACGNVFARPDRGMSPAQQRRRDGLSSAIETARGVCRALKPRP
jgi:hypothetical protein